MIVELLDEYALKVLEESGWSKDRKQDINPWIQILVKEGYKVNDYALSVLKELGNIKIRNERNHWGVVLYFNPVYAASGEYDRLEIFNAVSDEELFPIGECFDWVIYVGDSKKVYLGDWKSLSIAGDTIEEFLNNMFNPQIHPKEIYINSDSWD